MQDIGIRELKARVSQVVHRVMEEGARYVITYHGKPVATISPAIENALESQADVYAARSAWDELERLGQQIGLEWESDQTSAEILSQIRR